MNRVWLWEVLNKTKHESLQNLVNTFLTIKELTFEHIKVILCWPTRIKCNKPRALHKIWYPANGKNIFMLTRYVKPMEHDRGNGRSLLAWRPQSIVKIWRLNTVPNVRFRSKRLLTRLKTIKNNDEDDKKITIRTICGKRILMEANITERRATIKSTCENWHKQNKINHRAHVSVPFSRVTWSLSRGSVMWHLW